LTFETLNAHNEHIPLQHEGPVACVAAYARHRHDEEMEKLTESAKKEQHAMEIGMIQRERAFASEAAIAAERQIAETATQDRNKAPMGDVLEQGSQSPA
jgi:hypothetical protein